MLLNCLLAQGEANARLVKVKAEATKGWANTSEHLCQQRGWEPSPGLGVTRRLHRQTGERRGSDAEAQFLRATVPVPGGSYKRPLLT